ncbi:alpha/beta fold hydrolase [Phenylobacterium sp.]|uniref:alpha/beta fold hydrolase n=1 Tax=Phenylobacterium sp. TaxID=1871053 RepID=UPI0028115D10|nr:alpha/beta fold hydrolase [Phenylobacterium sp.]
MFVAVIASLALSSSSPALPRSAALGVELAAPPPGAPAGALVARFAAPAIAKAVKLEEGDTIVRIDRTAVGSPDDLLRAMRGRTAGSPVRLAVLRGGRSVELSGKLAARPFETYANGQASYGAVAFQGGLLRDIFVTPPGGAKGPVVFLLQGYTCDSMETLGPDSPHRQLFDGLLARGISIYRIEKPQAGDSRGGPACAEIDFETELKAFETGYRTLQERHGVTPDRIFLLGHSMGGIQAPIVAARNAPPRGVAIYGAVTRNWADYNLDIVKYQNFLSRGADPASSEIEGEKLRKVIHRLLIDGEPPKSVAADGPEMDRLLRAWFDWDGGDQLIGRHHQFWRQLTATPLLSAWRDTRSNVLAVYGESDFAAVDDEDHRLVTDVVNHYRPGTARFVSVPRTGHSMTIEGSREEVRARAGAAPAQRYPFNPELTTLFADWIEESMRAPAVASRFAPVKRGA